MQIKHPWNLLTTKTFVFFSGVRIDATEPKDAELPELPDDI